MIRPYLEIVTHPLKGAQVESFGGIAPTPYMIKPGETRDFSASLSSAIIFNAGPADLSQIESANFQLYWNGKVISHSTLDYVGGKWKVAAPRPGLEMKPPPQ